MPTFDYSLITKRRAAFIYEACRITAIAADAPIIPAPWHARERDFQLNFYGAVASQCGENRATSPEFIHNQWWETYKNMGWKEGPKYSADFKTHPDMIPYKELGQREKDKDEVFMAMCDIARKFIRDGER